MQYPVVALEDLNAVGITLGENVWYPETSTEAYLIQKIIETRSVLLTKDKTGQLAGYDPETQIQIGHRLILNENNAVTPDNMFWTNVYVSDKPTEHEMYETGLELVTSLSTNTHSYQVERYVPRGWSMGYNEDGKVVALCRNTIAVAQGVHQRGV